MANYKELIVWQKSTQFCVDIYKVTKDFPKDEQYGLISQLRRAAISIPSNIAEGSKRYTDKNYSAFLRIASGSGAEIETQLHIAKELEYINESTYLELTTSLTEVMKILSALIKKYSSSL